MNNKNPIQNLIPILGMTIGVAIGIMIGFVFNDPELRANMKDNFMARGQQKKEHDQQQE